MALLMILSWIGGSTSILCLMKVLDVMGFVFVAVEF
jgi:hypothetical protein